MLRVFAHELKLKSWDDHEASVDGFRGNSAEGLVDARKPNLKRRGLIFDFRFGSRSNPELGFSVVSNQQTAPDSFSEALDRRPMALTWAGPSFWMPNLSSYDLSVSRSPRLKHTRNTLIDCKVVATETAT